MNTMRWSLLARDIYGRKIFMKLHTFRVQTWTSSKLSDYPSAKCGKRQISRRNVQDFLSMRLLQQFFHYSILMEKWLVESTEGNVRCWYPTAIDGNKLNRLLAENTGPDQENWEMVAIEILKDKIGETGFLQICRFFFFFLVIHLPVWVVTPSMWRNQKVIPKFNWGKFNLRSKVFYVTRFCNRSFRN